MSWILVESDISSHINKQINGRQHQSTYYYDANLNIVYYYFCLEQVCRFNK